MDDNFVAQHEQQAWTKQEGIAKLTTWGAALTFLSSIIGGGIVGIPFAFYNAGVPIALLILAVSIFVAILSGKLYLWAKDMTPGKPENIYQLSFAWQRRTGIFVSGFIMFINSFGLMVVYFIIFGDTSATLMLSFTGRSQDQMNESFWFSRTCYVILVAVVLTPTILMKEISQLKTLSFAIFLLTLVFIAIFVICTFIIQPSGSSAAIVQEENFGDYMACQGIQGAMQASSIIIVALFYTMNLFPIHSQISPKTNHNTNSSVMLAIVMCSLVYIILGFAGLSIFGSSVTSNILTDLAETNNIVLSYTLRIIFVFVVLFHMPFIFYSGKESFLIVFDELDRKSLTKVLEEQERSMLNSTIINDADEEFKLNMVTSDEISLNQQKSEYISVNQSLLKDQANLEATNDEVQSKLEMSQLRTSKKSSVTNMNFTIGSDIEREDQTMAYKQMERKYYVAGSFFVWILEIICGIVVSDLTVAIGYVAAIGVTYMVMILPAYFYLVAETNFNEVYRKTHRSRRINAWGLIIFGILSFVVLMYQNITSDASSH